MNDLITVVINVYNGEKYISKCLESVLNQTYKNLEILIINDGSTDNTLKVIKKYKDSRIKIITQKNIGISLSRNVGIDNFKGEYVFYVDSDDYIEEDTIEYLYNICKKYNVLISTCRSKDIYDYNNKIINKKENIELIDDKEYIRRILLEVDRNGNIWGKLMHKDLIKKIRFEDRLISDVAVIHKLVMDQKIAYSNQMKYYYFKRNNGIVRSNNINWLKDLYKASLERYYYLKEKYNDFIENDIGLLLIIINIYTNANKELIDYLKEEKAFKKYNRLFKIKMLNKVNFKKKIKLLLFRISPKLYIGVTKIYLKTK